MAENDNSKNTDQGRYKDANFKVPLPLPVVVDQSTPSPTIVANVAELINNLGNKVVNTLKGALESLAKTTAAMVIKPYISEFMNTFNAFSQKLDGYFGISEKVEAVSEGTSKIASGIGEIIETTNNKVIGVLTEIYEQLKGQISEDKKDKASSKVERQHGGGFGSKVKGFFSGDFDEDFVASSGRRIFNRLFGSLTGAFEKAISFLFGSVIRTIGLALLAIITPTIMKIVGERKEGIDIVPAIMTGLGPIGGGIIGATIGSLFGGVGAIPGWIIGTVVGAAIGYISRELGVDKVQEIYTKTVGMANMVLEPLARFIGWATDMVRSAIPTIDESFANNKDALHKDLVHIGENLKKMFSTLEDPVFDQHNEDLHKDLVHVAGNLKKAWEALKSIPKLWEYYDTEIRPQLSSWVGDWLKRAFNLDGLKEVLFNDNSINPAEAISEKMKQVEDLMKFISGKITGFFADLIKGVKDTKLYQYLSGSTPEVEAPQPPARKSVPDILAPPAKPASIQAVLEKDTPKLALIDGTPKTYKVDALENAAKAKKALDMSMMSSQVSSVVNNRNTSSVSTVVNAPIKNTYSGAVTPTDSRLTRIGM